MSKPSVSFENDAIRICGTGGAKRLQLAMEKMHLDHLYLWMLILTSIKVVDEKRRYDIRASRGPWEQEEAVYDVRRIIRAVRNPYSVKSGLQVQILWCALVVAIVGQDLKNARAILRYIENFGYTVITDAELNEILLQT